MHRIIISRPYQEFLSDITMYIRLKIYFLNMNFFCSSLPPSHKHSKWAFGFAGMEYVYAFENVLYAGLP